MLANVATELAQRLLARSERSPEGCLRWTGAHFQKGYGAIVVDGQTRPVHIVAHEVWIGPVPEGYDVDHVHAKGCRHRDCIEPAHLEAVTHRENTLRRTRLITHCPKGHEYTPENIKWRRLKSGQPGRLCRRCFNDKRSASRMSGPEARAKRAEQGRRRRKRIAADRAGVREEARA